MRTRYFHYTIVDRLRVIVDSGAILASVANVPPGERPAVWCSSSPVWEETANKSIVLPDGRLVFGDRATTQALGGGLARIEVRAESVPHDWRAFKMLSGIVPTQAVALVESARFVGSSVESWRMSFTAIRQVDWIGIEIDGGQGWMPWDGANVAAQRTASRS